MGDWGYKPWDNDEGAGWFANFFKSVDISLIENEVENFDPKDELHYEHIRAAAYIVQCLCRPYIWPLRSDEDDPGALILKFISILSKMIDPEDTECTFLDMWDEDPEVIASVEEQITELKKRASRYA